MWALVLFGSVMFGFKYKEYMIFKHAERTNDDYKMMKDMFAYRFSTATLKKHKQPDLVIIDGGVGQLSCASAFIPVPHFALSKHEEADKAAFTQRPSDL